MAPAQEFGAAPIRTVRLEWFSQTYYRGFDGRGDPDCAVVVDVIAQGHLDVLQGSVPSSSVKARHPF